MPTGPTSLHKYWCDKGPYAGWGDQNAQAYLTGRGWKLTQRWEWLRPSPDYKPDAEELSAIDYLILEWDFGGFAA